MGSQRKKALFLLVRWGSEKTCVHTRAHTHKHVHTRTDEHTPIHIPHACIQTCMCTHTHPCIHTTQIHTYKHTETRIHRNRHPQTAHTGTDARICTHACMYTQVRARTHAQAHERAHRRPLQFEHPRPRAMESHSLPPTPRGCYGDPVAKGIENRVYTANTSLPFPSAIP